MEQNVKRSSKERQHGLVNKMKSHMADTINTEWDITSNYEGKKN
jgi:hypothetical protein